MDNELHTEKEIGKDVRRILKGRDVSQRGSVPDLEEPEIFPGMEDVGIGVKQRRRSSRRAGYEDAAPQEADGYEDGYYEDPDDARAADSREGRRRPPEPRPRRSGRWPYLFICSAFAMIFLFLIGQIIYFNLKLKDDIVNSPYNKRQSALANYVTRGDIRSYDGTTLATTRTAEDGTEERVYPYAGEYAHTVGYATHGRSGIESIANYQLLTSHANIIDEIINDFRGVKNKGDTVVSTLDSRLQDAAYNALGSYNGAVIAIDPKTGAVRAMVAKPNFDPNTLAETWDEIISDSSNSQLLNRATQGLYPPGSTFKMITSLAYFRKYHTFENFQYDCTGSFEVGPVTVHCFEGAEHGDEDYTSAFAHSCNTAFSAIGLDLGEKRLTDTVESLLFEDSLPCDLNASKSRWQLTEESGDAELVQTAFGQGKTLVTPYYMALLVSAIANDGVLMKPYLIDHVENEAGKTISSTRTARYKQLLTASEAAALRNLMSAVVTEGSARGLSGRGYTAAGKTGSAEYSLGDGNIGTHSWFVGYAGGDDPDLVVCVLAENGGAGSSTAVPIAAEVLDTYYSGIDEEYDAVNAEAEEPVPLEESDSGDMSAQDG